MDKRNYQIEPMSEAEIIEYSTIDVEQKTQQINANFKRGWYDRAKLDAIAIVEHANMLEKMKGK